MIASLFEERLPVYLTYFFVLFASLLPECYRGKGISIGMGRMAINVVVAWNSSLVYCSGFCLMVAGVFFSVEGGGGLAALSGWVRPSGLVCLTAHFYVFACRKEKAWLT